jgi:phenylacetate-coenzyme A ligase PaaK-like adenylate-forming protein
MAPMTTEALQQAIFTIRDDQDFESVAWAVFHHQIQCNPIYTSYCKHLGLNDKTIKSIQQIPFLPIEFFRSHTILCGNKPAKLVFGSSGTTGSIQSKHHLADTEIYIESFTRTFEQFYGDRGAYCLLALLPSYLERQDSSLVYMMDYLIKESKHPMSGFYQHNRQALATTLEQLKNAGQPTILLGVTFALLDLAEQAPVHFPELTIIETGGMKGRRREMVREEVHEKLLHGFGVSEIHSEYGMTEMLSQAYSKGEGIFETPPWMRILIRDTNDPLSLVDNGKTGGINVIDLANLHSCAFIATQDLGKRFEDGHFEVSGRFDHSDVRGCNLMVAW